MTITLFPNFPTSGKNAKVLMNTSDGAALNLEAMTLQATKTYRGKLYTGTIYLLGTGKTLINMRPEKQPVINIDGILAGLDITPGAADKVSASAGIIEVDGVQASVAANTAVALTIVTAAETVQWNAIIVDKATQVISAVAGTPVASATGVNDTYGTAAGNRPLIATDKLLVGWAEVGATGVLAASAISLTDREDGGIDYQILPNIGGVKIQSALVKCHAGAIGRAVKFSGNYLDSVMAEIPTAKSFTVTAQTSQLNDETFTNNYSSTTTGGFTFSYEQLAADTKALNNAWNRESHCAMRLQWPGGFFMQFVGSLAPNFNVGAAAMNSISVSGSCGDFPARSDEA